MKTIHLDIETDSLFAKLGELGISGDSIYRIVVDVGKLTVYKYLTNEDGEKYVIWDEATSDSYVATGVDSFVINWAGSEKETELSLKKLSERYPDKILIDE